MDSGHRLKLISSSDSGGAGHFQWLSRQRQLPASCPTPPLSPRTPPVLPRTIRHLLLYSTIHSTSHLQCNIRPVPKCTTPPYIHLYLAAHPPVSSAQWLLPKLQGTKPKLPCQWEPVQRFCAEEKIWKKLGRYVQFFHMCHRSCDIWSSTTSRETGGGTPPCCDLYFKF